MKTSISSEVLRSVRWRLPAVNAVCVLVIGVAGMGSGNLAAARQDDDLAWIVNEYEDSDTVTFSVSNLYYGIPQSDGIVLSATCKERSGGAYAELALVADTSRFAAGREVSVRLVAPGYDQILRGRATPEDNERAAGVQLIVGTDDVLWAALRKTGTFGWSIQGAGSREATLRGAASPVGSFVARCRAYRSTLSKPAQRFAGQNRSCADRRLAKSVGVGKAVSVTFVNLSDGRRSVSWRNEQGRLVPFGDLDYGESLVLNTFTNHPWEITDGPGNCIARVLITTSGPVDLVQPSPAFGPE